MAIRSGQSITKRLTDELALPPRVVSLVSNAMDLNSDVSSPEVISNENGDVSILCVTRSVFLLWGYSATDGQTVAQSFPFREIRSIRLGTTTGGEDKNLELYVYLQGGDLVSVSSGDELPLQRVFKALCRAL